MYMNKEKKIRTVRRILLVVIAVCLLLLGREYDQSRQQRIQQESLRAKIHEDAADRTDEEGAAVTGFPFPKQRIEYRPGENRLQAYGARGKEAEQVPVMLSKYVELYEENHDLAGWLSIEDMAIDYPVMQCEDDEYYLHHDFYGKDSKYGCLYVREQANLDAGTNFVIYGHNMKDGSMFGDLDLYLKEDFFREHTRISFDTLYEERIYEILAVFRSQVYNAEEDVFKYYQFYQADTQEEFDEFYRNIKELSLYDTGVEAQFGDTFLTLSTCAYHVKDGRLAVVAKRIA